MKAKYYSYEKFRLPEDAFTHYMHNTFGISIEQDEETTYNGFVKKYAWFTIYVPKITNGEFSLLHDKCEREHAYGITGVKETIKRLMNEKPEVFEILYNYFENYRRNKREVYGI